MSYDLLRFLVAWSSLSLSITMMSTPFVFTLGSLALPFPAELELGVFFNDPLRLGGGLLSTSALSLIRHTSTGTPADSRTSIQI